MSEIISSRKGSEGARSSIKPAGWEAVVPDHPTLGDVDSAEALAEYQAGKRARKAAARAAAGEPS